MRQLKIDPEFRDKIPPLTEDEFTKLRQNILDDGEVREPLVVWNGTIIDGHNRWKVIQEFPKIPYKIKNVDFADKYAAIVWICRNQLGRRNITDERKTALIGEAYNAQKMSIGNHAERGEDGKYLRSEVDLRGKRGKTGEKIAKEFGVGYGTVLRAKDFVNGLNDAEKVSPGFKDSVLSGAIKASKSQISEIRNLSDDEKKVAVEAIKEGKKLEKKSTGRLSSSDIDLIEKISAGLKNMDKPPATKEELAEDFGRILMNGIREAEGWLEPRYKEMGPTEIEKITAALERAETAIIKMKGMVSK